MKKSNLTKVQEAYRLEEVKRKREKVKEELYPQLLKYCKTVNDAKVFLDAFAVAIEQGAYKLKEKVNLSELGLIEMLDIKSTHYQQHSKLLLSFADESISTTLELIQGVSGEIERSLREENAKRSLKELNLKFL